MTRRIRTSTAVTVVVALASTSLVAMVATALPSLAVMADPAPGLIAIAAGGAAGGFSGDGGPAVSAQLSSPGGVDFDDRGNLFVADRANGRIRRVDAISGIITTVAGGGSGVSLGDGGLATAAFLYNPYDVAVAANGDVYIADSDNHKIRRVDATTGLISTVAGVGGIASGGGFSGDGGPANAAALRTPYAIDVDGSGNLYVFDSGNARVRRVDATTGVISTVAGNGLVAYAGDGGPATAASISRGSGVAVDSVGNLFISDTATHRIRMVAARTGLISTVAGTGAFVTTGDGAAAVDAGVIRPGGLDVDAAGNLFVATGESRVRRVDAATGIIGTVVGTVTGDCGIGGAAITACITTPDSVAVSPTGIIAVDSQNRVLVTRAPSQAPGAPQTLVAAYQPAGCCSPAAIDVTWQAPLTPTNRARVTVDPGGFVVVVAANAGRVLIPGVLDGTDYTITVDSFDGWTYSSPASTRLRTPGTPPPTVPGEPVDVAGSGGRQEVGLSWTAPATGDPADAYEIEWRLVGNGFSTFTIVPVAPFQLSVAVLAPHEIRVRGLNAVGPGPWSPWVTVVPTANTRPSAADDFYLLDGVASPSGWELRVPAPGVLGNDIDADGDPLVVTAVTDPASGSLRIEPDGSLVYSWTEVPCGPIESTYTVSDGVGEHHAWVVFQPPKPCLSITSPQVWEGALGEVSSADFLLTLSWTPATPVVVRLTTVAASASAGDDFLPLDLVIDATLTTKFSVPIIGDIDPEPDEVFYLLVTTSDGVVVGDNLVGGRYVPASILDDDNLDTPEKLARALQQAGESAAVIVTSLNQSFTMTAAEIAAVMTGVGVAVSDVLVALHSELRLGWAAAVAALGEAGVAAADVLDALVLAGFSARGALIRLLASGWDTFAALSGALVALAANSIEAVMSLARQARLDLAVIAAWLVARVDGIDTCDEIIAPALAAGFSGELVAAALLNPGRAPEPCLPAAQEAVVAAGILIDIGVRGAEAFGILLAAFGKGPEIAAGLLLAAGATLEYVVGGLRALGFVASQAFDLLVAAGVSAVDAALAVGAEFRLGANALIELLFGSQVTLPEGLTLLDVVLAVGSALEVPYRWIIEMAIDRGIPADVVFSHFFTFAQTVVVGGPAAVWTMVLTTLRDAQVELIDFATSMGALRGADLDCFDLFSYAIAAGYEPAAVGAVVAGELACTSSNAKGIIDFVFAAGGSATEALAASQAAGATGNDFALFLLLEAGYQLSEAVGALRTVLSASIQQVSDALWAVGVPATDAALALAAVFTRASIRSIAGRLYDALYNDMDVARAIAALGSDGVEFALLARQRGRAVVSVGRALLAEFTPTAAGVAEILLQSGWGLADIVVSLRDLGVSAHAAILVLIQLGVDAGDAAVVVDGGYGPAAGVGAAVAEWLFDAGVTVSEIATTLKRLGDSSWQTATKLGMLGISAAQNGAALLAAWGNHSGAWLAKRLINAGYGLTQVFTDVISLIPTTTLNELVVAARQQLTAAGVAISAVAERVVTALLEFIPDDLSAVAAQLQAGGFAVAAAAAGLESHAAGATEWFLAMWSGYPAASPMQLVSATAVTIADAASWLYDEGGQSVTYVIGFIKAAGATSTVAAGILFDLGVSALDAANALTENFAISLSAIVNRLLSGGYAPAAVASAMALLGQSPVWVAQRFRAAGINVVSVGSALVGAFDLGFSQLVGALTGGGFTAAASEAAACFVLGC